MKAATISLLIATGIFAGYAAGADKSEPAPPAGQAPAAAPGTSDYCTRRDISAEDYSRNCTVQNGPPHRPVHRKQGVQSRSGGGAR